jgi:2-succinyl-6-hydroxy-2,4-cyclohexadiene-1-carboxylate synthase
MPTIALRGVDYYYEATDVPQATYPPRASLVLLHGFTGSTASWAAHVQAFAPYYRVITVDLLGHGQTGAPADPTRYRIEQSAGDLALLLAAVAPGPVNLVGYSMGGRLALYFAVTYPHRVQRLILESASPGLADPVARQERIRSDERLAGCIESEGIAAFVEQWEQLPLFASQHALPEAVRIQLRTERMGNRAHGLANSLRGMGTGVQPSIWEQLPALATPTLLLAGELDPKFMVIAAQMAAHLPHATLMSVPRAGHTIHLEQPLAFQRQVLTFLNSDQAS